MGTPSPESDRAPLPLPNKTSIAILPFADMSGDLEQEYFADSMVEEMEIISALSRVRLALLRSPQLDLNLQRPSWSWSAVNWAPALFANSWPPEGGIEGQFPRGSFAPRGFRSALIKVAGVNGLR
jgi:hypothetical protein